MDGKGRPGRLRLIGDLGAAPPRRPPCRPGLPLQASRASPRVPWRCLLCGGGWKDRKWVVGVGWDLQEGQSGRVLPLGKRRVRLCFPSLNLPRSTCHIPDLCLEAGRQRLADQLPPGRSPGSQNRLVNHTKSYDAGVDNMLGTMGRKLNSPGECCGQWVGREARAFKGLDTGHCLVR